MQDSKDHIPRFYEPLLAGRLASERQMAFVSGPRQVGKTTIGKALAQACFSWDNPTFKRAVLTGADAVAQLTGANRLADTRQVFLFDEIHKFTRWKAFLKGFFDEYGASIGLLVSGSAKLNVFKRGGDSLMGRYFNYRVHPLSVGELLSPVVRDGEVCPPAELPDGNWEAMGLFLFRRPDPPKRRCNTSYTSQEPL